MSPLNCLMHSPPAEDSEEQENLQTQSTLEMMEVEESPLLVKTEPDPTPVSHSNSPVCIGPGCSKSALPESVYCGSDCIMQHAAATIKNLSVPKAPKTRARAQRKAAPARAPAKAQRGSRVSKRLANREVCEETKEEDKPSESESSQTCDPSVTEAQATQYNASAVEDLGVAADVVDSITPSEQISEESFTETAPTAPPPPTAAPAPKDNTLSPKPAPEPTLKQQPPEKAKETIINKNVSKLSSTKVNSPKPSIAFTSPAKPIPSQPITKQTKPPETSPPAPPVNRLHETGAIMVKKTAFVIPKKTPAPQTRSNQVPPPSLEPTKKTSPGPSLEPTKKPSPAPTSVVQPETRNLPVPPAPSAPSSRPPSQPNNQIRQSIQRSLVGILFKRVCDSEELDMSENDVGKLVTNIETEMFNIFRNTDSKYMNKYRTIMFNLKDPKNKGLLFRLVQGEISPFRLVRMSQKDMQAIQPPEPPKEVKATTSVRVSLQKPEPVKLDLPSLIQTRTDRTKNVPLLEQKKTVPESIIKSKMSQSNQGGGAIPDILTCMLKDTTAEHHKHLFDVKCKICTGQMPQDEVGEPVQKKKRVSEEKHEPLWKRSKGEDSPLLAPPDSPDMDSPVPHFTMGSPVLTIVESPASPTTQDSPASPSMDTPASPVMESPASPSSDDRQSAPMKSYTPVVIPAVSTVTITRRDPRTAANRYAALTNSSAALSDREIQKSDSYFSLNDTPAPPVSLPSATILPKSILMKPSHSGDPRLYGSSSRNPSPKISCESGTPQFLSKQDILWKGFLNMLTIAKFVTKGYLVSGPAEHLKADLPDTIQIGGRILPKTVWDYVAKLKTSVTKELCVIRFQPATDEEEVAYVSLFSYFSSRGRFGVVANNSRSIKDMYLFPLSAKEAVPAILQPLEGPGFEKNRPNLLLGLAIIQKSKRPGSLSTELEEKRPKVSMSSDPSWIPKPPSLYGSNKEDDFQPYDPEIPISITPPSSPPKSNFNSTSVTTTSVASVSQSKTSKESSSSKSNTATSSNETPLQTILKQLFSTKQTEANVSSDASSTAKAARSKKCPLSMVDPIVQQFGGKTTVKEIEEEDNDDLDRPYDPEEEYDPVGGYGVVPKSSIDIKENIPEFTENVNDDVAYDPEDETIFDDIRNENTSKNISDTTQVPKPNSPTILDSPQVTPAPVSKPSPTQIVAPFAAPSASAAAPPAPPAAAPPAPPAAAPSSPPAAAPAAVAYAVPTGTVVISAETLTEQQRMLEELNRQIEEQKRQLREQEEALRKQREAVGMFMAQFSVSDSLVSPSSSALPLNKLVTLQGGATEPGNSPVLDTTSEKDNSVSTIINETDNLNDKSETLEASKENENAPSPGEVGDSDVAYDPEDESLFDEIQAGMLEKPRSKSRDSSVSKNERSSGHSKRHKYSPKRRSNHERSRHRSPSRRSQRRSPSRSRRRRDRDRHHRSERTISRHRSRDRSERPNRTRRDSTSQTRSRRCRRSSSSQRNKNSASLSPRRRREHSQLSQIAAKSEISAFATQAKNLEENLPSQSPNNTNDVDTEETLLTFLVTQEQLASNDNTPGDLKQLKWARDLLMDGKLDSLIPLRELEPPTRDSPQSPDPEPRFSEDVSESTNIIKMENNVKLEPTEENIKIESCSQPILTLGNTLLNEQKPVDLVETAAVACVKVEFKSEETISEIKKLDDPKPFAVETPPTKNEDSPCKDSIPGLGDLENILQASRDDSPTLTDPKQNTNKLEDMFSKPNKDIATLRNKGTHDQQFSSRNQMTENLNADRGIRNKESANSNFSQNTLIGLTRDQHSESNFGKGERRSSLERDFSQRNPNIWNTGPVTFTQSQNIPELQEIRCGGDIMGLNPRGDMTIGSDISFANPSLHGHLAGTNNPKQPEQRGADFHAPWNNSGPAFRGRNSRGLPFEGPGSHRGRHGGPQFDRGGEPRDSSIDRPGPHRDKTVDSNFGEFEHRDTPIDCQGPHKGGFGRGGPMEAQRHYRDDLERQGEPGFDRGSSMDGPGPRRGGFGGPGFGRGGEHRGPVDGPGHHKGGRGEPDSDNGLLDGPGPHRGGFRGPGFGRGGEYRGGPMDVSGSKRVGLEGPEFDRGPVDGPGSYRGGFRGPGFGRAGEHLGGPMDSPQPHRGSFGGPGLGRDSPMGGPGHQSGDHEEPEFERIPMDGPPQRGGFRGPRFSRGLEHGGGLVENPGPHSGGHGDPDVDRGPMDGPGPHRGGFGGSGLGRGGEHRGGPLDGLGSQRGGFKRAIFGNEGSMGGPVPQCGGHEESEFDRDAIDGPPHRGGFRGPCFGRGGEHHGPGDGSGPRRGGFGGLRFGRGRDNGGDPIDNSGPHRGGHEEPDFDRGPMDGPGPQRGGFGGPGLGRGGPIGGPGHQRGRLGEPDYDRDSTMDVPGPRRFQGSGFGRDGPIGGLGPQSGEDGEPQFDRGTRDGLPQRGGFRGPGFGRSGERHGPIDGPGHHRGGHGELDYDMGPMDGPGSHRGGFGGPGFGRGGEHRGGPMDGPGHLREAQGGPEFDREGPMDNSEPQRGGFGGSGFGRGGGHKGGPMDGFHREGYGDQMFGRGGGPSFNSTGPVDGPGPNRRGHGGQGFGRGGERAGGPRNDPGWSRGAFSGPDLDIDDEQRDMGDQRPHKGFGGPGFGNDGPMDGPGPNRGGYGGPGFDRGDEHQEGPIDGPSPLRQGPHRGGFGGPGFGRGSPMDGPGPHRGGHKGLGPGRDWEHRGGPREPGFGGDGENRGGPICDPELYRGPDFERGAEYRCGPMDGPGPVHSGIPRAQDFRGRDGPGNPRSHRGGPMPDFGPEGEVCSPGNENWGAIRGNPHPSIEGPQHEGKVPDNRGQSQTHEWPFGGLRDGPDDRQNRGDFSGPRHDQRPEGWRPEDDWNQNWENRQDDDRPERSRPGRDRRSHDSERNRGRDMRGEQCRPLHRRSSSRDRSTHRRDQDSGPKSDLPKVDSDPKSGEIKDPTSGATRSEQSDNTLTDTEQMMPPRHKTPLLPTPPDGPLFPFQSHGRQRGRGRGGRRR
ncbi:death-inducer obliterator 1-like [Boleophthalmus pectinirostris]|uniref:death-inducer obliterator 1-like n=1 Tax=Boleophthalmus pectinirostris TaxID=150288 RepID=UPI00242D707A|nr:death-inducer obliterator 1-like [Boleophthalmus pectinirostris]